MDIPKRNADDGFEMKHDPNQPLILTDLIELPEAYKEFIQAHRHLCSQFAPKSKNNVIVQGRGFCAPGEEYGLPSGSNLYVKGGGWFKQDEFEIHLQDDWKENLPWIGSNLKDVAFNYRGINSENISEARVRGLLNPDEAIVELVNSGLNLKAAISRYPELKNPEKAIGRIAIPFGIVSTNDFHEHTQEIIKSCYFDSYSRVKDSAIQKAFSQRRFYTIASLVPGNERISSVRDDIIGMKENVPQNIFDLGVKVGASIIEVLDLSGYILEYRSAHLQNFFYSDRQDVISLQADAADLINLGALPVNNRARFFAGYLERLCTWDSNFTFGVIASFEKKILGSNKIKTLDQVKQSLIINSSFAHGDTQSLIDTYALTRLLHLASKYMMTTFADKSKYYVDIASERDRILESLKVYFPNTKNPDENKTAYNPTGFF
jgi:hypothetical protein